jgi:rare lipoprotein A
LRPEKPVRSLRAPQMTIGTSLLAVPVSAVALTGVAAAAGFAGPAPAVQQGAITADVSPKHLAYGHEVKVVGAVPPASAGRTLALELAAAPNAGYRTLARTRIGPSGRFSVSAPLRRSGYVRVAELDSATAPASVPQRVTVKAALRVPMRAADVLGGRAVALRGKLLPTLAGRQIRLEARSHHVWRTLTSARTGSKGGFRLRFVPQQVGHQQLLVTFGGDQANTRATRRTGVTVFTESVASWYNDAGTTACGFHASYGVANRGLPCGSKVTFRNGGRTVNAVVDDRGPFVGGREWDLNQNTAGALGFGGVGAIWSSR